MDSAKHTISKLLVSFADALNSMDEQEFEQLIRGEGRLRFVSTSRSRNGRKVVVTKELQSAVKEVAKKLKNATSRETAEQLLATIDYPRRKDFLILLAQESRVRVESRDTIARIEHKLIERVVGTKLRSKAFKEVSFR